MKDSSCVYFVISGMFEATQRMSIKDAGMNLNQRNQLNNKSFIIKRKQNFINDMVENDTLDNYSNDPYAMDLLSSSLERLPKRIKEDDSKVLRKPENRQIPAQPKGKKPMRRNQPVAVYGPGMVFGHYPQVLSQFKHYQPVTIKCSSQEAWVFKISTIEFEKNVLNYKRVREFFNRTSMAELRNNNLMQSRCEKNIGRVMQFRQRDVRKAAVDLNSGVMEKVL